MQEKQSFKPFRRELLSLLLTIIIIILLIVEGSNALVFRELNLQYQANEARNVRNNVEQTLTFQDQAYLLYEQQLEERMQQAMALFQQQYLATGEKPEQIDLFFIQSKVGPDIDLFILDEENRVCCSTFTPDLNLIVVREHSSLAKKLTQIRESGEYWVDRPSISSFDGVKKFSYQSTPDGKYVLEVGIALSQHYKALSSIDFEAVVAKLVKEHELLAAVRVYDRAGSAFTTEQDGSHQPLSGDKLTALRMAVQTGTVQYFKEGNLLYEYLPLPGQKEYLTGKVVEIVFDNAKWQTRWHKYLLLHGAIALLAVVSGVLCSLWLTDRTARPILELSQSVRRIADGDFSEPVQVSSNNEIGALSSDIDGMRQKLAAMIACLEDSNQQLAQGYDLTIRAFFKALEHRESRTASHSLRVNRIAMDIGRKMKLPEEKLLMLEWGTLLHDIGKLAIEDAVLLKPGPLSASEYEKMKSHPRIGYEMLQDAAYLREALEISLFHHEYYDGSGYPQRLRGEEIPLLARICAVADAFEAMTADRPYRNGIPLAEAVAELRRCSGTQFDPAVIEVFLSLSWEDYQVTITA